MSPEEYAAEQAARAEAIRVRTARLAATEPAPTGFDALLDWGSYPDPLLPPGELERDIRLLT